MIRTGILLASLAGAALAAEEGSRFARFLPVGDAPPFRQEVRDGVRYELEAPAGSIPPREALHGEDERIPLRLGTISRGVSVPAGSAPLVLTQPDRRPWLRMPKPEAGDFLVLLWRVPGGDWSEVSHLAIPDGPLGAPPGTIRIANLFPAQVTIEWDGTGIPLKPGATTRRAMRPGQPAVLRIFANDATGQPRRYHSGQIMQNPGERSLVVIYRADGESPRRPLKVLNLREPAPLPPPAENGTEP